MSETCHACGKGLYRPEDDPEKLRARLAEVERELADARDDNQTIATQHVETFRRAERTEAEVAHLNKLHDEACEQTRAHYLENIELRGEVERLRAVAEAAKAWSYTEDDTPDDWRARQALLAAVELLELAEDARGEDNG